MYMHVYVRVKTGSLADNGRTCPCYIHDGVNVYHVYVCGMYGMRVFIPGNQPPRVCMSCVRYVDLFCILFVNIDHRGLRIK